MFRSLILAGCSALLIATSASAQTASFPERVQPTLPTNEHLVQQIRIASPSSDLAVLDDQTAAARATGEELEQELALAIAGAPDDPSRSRLEGVLTHTQAALAALRQTSQETSLDAGRGRLSEALGEAQEGIDELRPFVEGLHPVLAASPALLPEAGSLTGPELALVPALGAILLVTGLVLRRGSTKPRRPTPVG